ncbi:glycosyltransferase [Streptomyces sp. NPDC001595]|uniref:glycosyltransferase family 4 protein n=1 Tax=Streptomyces sp. NPDC001532 TaxID=3154520 RepID=UPI00332EA736
MSTVVAAPHPDDRQVSDEACRRDPDPLVAARTAFYTSPVGPPGAASDLCLAGTPHDGLLTRLLAAEYGRRPPAGTSRRSTVGDRNDAAVASLRRACRLAVPLAPEALLAHAHLPPRRTAVLLELWAETLRWHGARHATEALRAQLTDHRPRTVTAMTLLLELAAAGRLRPLSATEAAALCDHSAPRALRHALWRYLHLLPDGPAQLPAPATASDHYEQLLLAPPTPTTADDIGSGGLLVAQTMLLGGLDTAGQGASGGLATLLAGLGDHLAADSAIDGVLTVVTAGHDDLATDPALLRPRAAGHWELRLPVDAPTTPPQADLHIHRAALTWWAVRLMSALPRHPDVLHVRYADDGSLALAHAAVHLGADLVFTATPDPHRHVTQRYAGADPTDAKSAEELREDLHKVFLADRLVERARAVVAIPGSAGTAELTRFLPVLAAVNGGAGPKAAPEGIAPYRPATDEHERREALLRALFADGSRPDALAPRDRRLPLLLCVGRFDRSKQQHLLVRTWLSTGLWRRTTLVLVGGSRQRPTKAEQEMRRLIRDMLRGQPQAARRIAMLPALPNDVVRRLERALADRTDAPQAWYVCPSRKEEFGIAVLEAMESGLPVAAPRRGGVPHYLHDGVNGILWDTSTTDGLAQGLHRLTTMPEPECHRLAETGRHTVLSRFSVAVMADALVGEYRRVHERGL